MTALTTYPDAESLTQGAAEQFVSLYDTACAEHGMFTVALAGGSTPRALYALLAKDAWASRIDWTKVYLFWGDERCVSPDHPDSNYRMVRETLLSHVQIPPANVSRIRGDRDPGFAASTYEATLREFFARRAGQSNPQDAQARFDLVLLGMGSDGHTASIFPGTPALHEQTRWVVAHYVKKLGAWRITMTPVCINAARNIRFFVAGADKAARLKQVLYGPYQPDIMPAQAIKPQDGTLVWLVDKAAASYLEQES
jgi:6-phosphogluconolactonase